MSKIPVAVAKPFATFAPLKVFLGYLVFTLALAIWGPTQYYMFPVGKTVLFMTAVVAMVVFGYTFGAEAALPPTQKPRWGHNEFVRRLFDISLAISFFALAISLATAINSGQLNTDFSSIGDAYLSGYEGYERNTGNYSLEFIMYSVSLPFNFIALVLGFYYLFSFDALRRNLVVIFAIASLIFYVLGSGKQKQLGDILIYLLTIAALKYGVKRKPIQMKWIAAIGAVGIIGVLAFVAILSQRYGALGVDVGNVNQRVLYRIYIDTNHPVFSIFGENYGLNLSMFLSYLSQGYYGLGLALETPWHWTHFQGFSYSVSVLSNRVLGLDWEWPNTLVYQVGLTTGWGESKWHTVFTHLATDVTFPGTALLFGFFAYVFARSWRASIRYENPFAILMFALLSLGAFFVPANNQLLHTPGALFTTIVISILYMTMGRRFNLPEEVRQYRPIWGRKREAHRL
jgi:hypothetical protein